MCRLKKTVTYIKKHTAKWTVGPMDFCIVGHVFTDVGKRSVLCRIVLRLLLSSCVRKAAICRGDPVLTEMEKYALERVHDTRHRYPAGKHKKHIENKYQDKWRILREQDKVVHEEQLQHRRLIRVSHQMVVWKAADILSLG